MKKEVITKAECLGFTCSLFKISENTQEEKSNVNVDELYMAVLAYAKKLYKDINKKEWED